MKISFGSDCCEAKNSWLGRDCFERWYPLVPAFGQCGTMRYRCQATDRMMTTLPSPDEPQEGTHEAAVRARILQAAFAAFMKSGYAATSTLEIASQARVSKRELYALVGNKQKMLMACISARARRLQMPAALPDPADRETLGQVLACFGTQLVLEISDPTVIAVFRLAISEAVHTPEAAQALDSIGRETSRAALRQIMARSEESGILIGHPSELAAQFGALLWGNLIVDMLLGVAKRPSSREAATRAQDATAAFLQLHPPR